MSSENNNSEFINFDSDFLPTYSLYFGLLLYFQVWESLFAIQSSVSGSLDIPLLIILCDLSVSYKGVVADQPIPVPKSNLGFNYKGDEGRTGPVASGKDGNISSPLRTSGSDPVTLSITFDLIPSSMDALLTYTYTPLPTTAPDITKDEIASTLITFCIRIFYFVFYIVLEGTFYINMQSI